MYLVIIRAEEEYIYLRRGAITQLALVILVLVFILIALRQVGGYSIRIWQIMLIGAGGVLFTGQISLSDAFHAINPGVMFFLLGMFVIGEGVKSSGILEDCISWICHHAHSGEMLLALIIGTMGLLSAVLINDTIAIIGAPLILTIADRFLISKPGAMIALCFSVTTGSVFSPIGNPQNYLIASYIPELSPYLLFFIGLFIPTILSMGVIYAILRPLFRKVEPENLDCMLLISRMAIDRWPVYLSFIILVVGVGLQILDGLQIWKWSIPIEWIALTGAIPVVVFSKDKIRLFKDIDWYTLIFFAAMFILMQSVYDTGFFQDLLPETGISDVFFVMTAGVLLSQVISNVPFVALFQPLLLSPGVSPSVILALAAGSTIAGNLTILGAASNVIIIQQAERRGVHIPMMLFCRYGIPVTICQMLIYTVYIHFICLFGF
ncbi:putative transporter [anaerobic digester metagenome]